MIIFSKKCTKYMTISETKAPNTLDCCFFSERNAPNTTCYSVKCSKLFREKNAPNILDCAVRKWANIPDCPEKEINIREASFYAVFTIRYFIDSWIFPRTGVFHRFSLSLSCQEAIIEILRLLQGTKREAA
jgi:hypothetical protein